MVAGFQVDGDQGVREVLEVDGEDFLRDVVVVEFVVAHGDVDVDGEEVAVFEEDAFVDVDGFLVVRAEVVDGGETELEECFE
jgi:hypothetical protein